jgi:hypothetical protein
MSERSGDLKQCIHRGDAKNAKIFNHFVHYFHRELCVFAVKVVIMKKTAKASTPNSHGNTRKISTVPVIIP